MQRVLIVDDEETIAFAAARYLATRGFEVDMATSEGDAERLLSSRDYEALVVDLRLGPEGHEGFRLIELARRLMPSIAVVLITAYGAPAVEARARELAVDSLIKKPATLAHLAEVLTASTVGEPRDGGA